MRKTLVIVLFLVAVVSFGEEEVYERPWVEALTGEAFLDCTPMVQSVLILSMAHVVHYINAEHDARVDCATMEIDDITWCREWLIEFISVGNGREALPLFYLFVLAHRVWEVESL